MCPEKEMSTIIEPKVHMPWCCFACIRVKLNLNMNFSTRISLALGERQTNCAKTMHRTECTTNKTHVCGISTSFTPLLQR